jgi:hypothetical protein
VPVEKLQTESCINWTSDKKKGRSRRVAWGKESRGGRIPKTTSLRWQFGQHELCRATRKKIICDLRARERERRLLEQPLCRISLQCARYGPKKSTGNSS